MRKSALIALTIALGAPGVWAQAAPPPALGSGLGQMLLGLGGVLALLVGSLWLLKRLTAVRGPASSMMRVVAATAVGGRERVVIVEVGNTWLVLGVAPGRVSALAEVPRQAMTEPPPANTPSAATEWLQRLVARR